jgi:hypothetical protein
MPSLQVKKAVAVSFLEAAKLTLEHLAAYRLELSQSHVDASPDLARLYGNLRRVRDYLQRCVSAFLEVVSLDLTSSDAALLVACCRRAVSAIEFRRTQSTLSPDEDDWLIRNRQQLSDWAVEIAASPLMDLPLRPLSAVPTEADRALTTRLMTKMQSSGEARRRYCAPQASAKSKSLGVFSVGDPRTFRGAGPKPIEQVESHPRPAEKTPSSGLSAEQAESGPSLAALIDPAKLRDPRLRALVKLDLTSLGRCYQGCDYRLATVLLASIMESAILDHVIPRRAELGLSGSPDSWRLDEVVLHAMGESVQPKDRSMAFHLFASRNLMFPAMQIVTPVVITASSFQSLHEFVVRALYEIGFGAPAASRPTGFLSNEDMLH